MIKDTKYRDMRRLEEERSKYRIQCKCGTKTIMTDADRTICRGCGHWIYRTKEIEFKEKMKHELRRNLSKNC